MDDLIKELEDEGVLKTKTVIQAMRSVDRSGFVIPEYSADSSLNQPLPIGYGQTISQPQTVAFMLELLQVGEAETVLDVGAGSGWTAALLANIVGPSGKVYAIELIPQLKTLCLANLARAEIQGVEVMSGDGSNGLPEFAPFDRIHVAAATSEIPKRLVEQLRVGGRMVIPVGGFVQEIVLLERIGKNEIREERYPGFQFVPLVSGSDR